MTLQPYYVQIDNVKKNFSDLRKANEYAQERANALKRTVVRCDIWGGQAWFRPEVRAQQIKESREGL